MDKVFSDDDIMPFGKHKGKLLGTIPFSYFRWLWHTWEDENVLKDKLKDQSDNGKLARYIEIARRAEKK